MKGREAAMFFSGFAANQVLTHGALALGGVEFTLFGIAYDPQLNMTAVAAWAILFAVLVYFAGSRDTET